MSTPKDQVQMGGTPNMPDTSKPPPAWRGPDENEYGLGDMKQYMSEGAWTVFIANVAWCIHWQDLADARKFDVAGQLNLFAAPYVGLGDPNVWPIYQQVVSTLVLAITMTWFEEGAEYRKDNSLVWSMINQLAPVLAQTSKGYSARLAVKDLLKSGSMRASFR